ncbi:esterase [Bacillus sp. FJAT-27225]|uniref:alpha/beta hydrolase n=1 Tax=Bacillus sp. FJAT-27225 TaxID=1743144 RepID=UPI00080C3368|nr:dienelactone hydrolase family protein [Bacillus sp. FJAT-27225]OCA84410.1 esterase [Bacillus sp. FJAT-27225]
MTSSMMYTVLEPKEADPNKKYPALFVMHGIGSNEQNMLSLVNGLEEEFIIFSIRGHLEQPPGFAYFTIEGYGKPHRPVFDDAIARLSDFISSASSQYPIDESRIFLLGFSQGAILSMTLALTLGSRIKGIVALNGYIPQFVKEEYPVQPIGHLSAFVSHGEHDTVFPLEWGKANKEYLERLGADVAFNVYPEGHTVSMANYQDYVKWLLKSIN